ncbi:DUF992 domain-containing protein [Methylobacterium nigriterrae]|uniref:DUF992 domain-containing protein n=1 Tax=Methylobacterium nigriterrae TaxID=3127512 RepID=UPI00301399C1
MAPRATTLALSAALLAAGLATAHGALTRPQDRTAGTLTCVTRKAGLVFGLTPVAECLFVSERGDFQQSYAALFSAGRGRGAAGVETVRWRVLTRGGASEAGMLSGAFAFSPEEAARLGGGRVAPALNGPGGSLELLSHSGQTSAAFAQAHPRIALAPLAPAVRR